MFSARAIRSVRFIRLVRLGRSIHTIQSLRLFILSMLAAGVSLLWCLLMISTIIYFFAVCFLNGVTEYFRDGAANTEVEATIVQLYGDVRSAMTTLFMCISGGIDWQRAMDPLVTVHWVYRPIFIYYIFFMVFGVSNIVVGVFVSACTETVKGDRKLLVTSKLEALEAYKAKVKGFFAAADADESGTLSWEEFQEHLKNPRVMAYFTSLDLDVSNAHRLFRLMDTDGNNEVGFDEFLDGCTRLKGEARSIDVNMLVHAVKKLSLNVSRILKQSEREHLEGASSAPAGVADGAA